MKSEDEDVFLYWERDERAKMLYNLIALEKFLFLTCCWWWRIWAKDILIEIIKAGDRKATGYPIKTHFYIFCIFYLQRECCWFWNFLALYNGTHQYHVSNNYQNTY